MKKDFEDLKKQFGTVNLKADNSKLDREINLLQADIREFASSFKFSLDGELFSSLDRPLGPHGHKASTYILNWNHQEVPLKLSLTNKLAKKTKSLSDCPDYLKEFVKSSIEEFVGELQKAMKLDKEKLVDELYEEEAKRSKTEDNDLP